MVDVAVFDAHVQPSSAHHVNFNPCQDDNGRCQQFCFAIEGQDEPKCGCAHGSLLSNGVTCGYGQDEFLVFTTDNSLNSLRLDPDDHSIPFPEVTLGYQTMAVDYDFKEGRVFFTKSMGPAQSIIGYITTASPTSPAVTIATSESSLELLVSCVCFLRLTSSCNIFFRLLFSLFSLIQFHFFTSCVILFFFCVSLFNIFSLWRCSDLDDPEGLAYDWVNKRLYFTDFYAQNVQSVGVDGENRTIIAHASSPRGIVVDPCYG